MIVILLLGAAIAAGSIWGAAYLLSLWHEDAAALRKVGRVTWRTWPFSRVLAYVSIACTLSSNYLIVPTALRLFEIPNFREIAVALTPFTITALLVLDVAFVLIALYLRLLRRRRHARQEDALDQASGGVRGAPSEGLLEAEVSEDLERIRSR